MKDARSFLKYVFTSDRFYTMFMDQLKTKTGSKNARADPTPSMELDKLLDLSEKHIAWRWTDMLLGVGPTRWVVFDQRDVGWCWTNRFMVVDQLRARCLKNMLDGLGLACCMVLDQHDQA